MIIALVSSEAAIIGCALLCEHCFGASLLLRLPLIICSALPAFVAAGRSSLELAGALPCVGIASSALGCCFFKFAFVRCEWYPAIVPSEDGFDHGSPHVSRFRIRQQLQTSASSASLLRQKLCSSKYIVIGIAMMILE